MPDYRETAAKFSEKLALDFLNASGTPCFANNLEDIGAVDIRTVGGFGVDVQYSASFARYGDFRLDVVSAFFSGPPSGLYGGNDPVSRFLSEFESRFACAVMKPGKIFLPGYLDFLLVFFYNHGFEKRHPDYVFIISKSEILRFLFGLGFNLAAKAVLNRKTGLGDAHGSAFIPLSVGEIAANVSCIFAPMDALLQNPMLARGYFSASRPQAVAK